MMAHQPAVDAAIPDPVETTVYEYHYWGPGRRSTLGDTVVRVTLAFAEGVREYRLYSTRLADYHRRRLVPAKLANRVASVLTWHGLELEEDLFPSWTNDRAVPGVWVNPERSSHEVPALIVRVRARQTPELELVELDWLAEHGPYQLVGWWRIAVTADQKSSLPGGPITTRRFHSTLKQWEAGSVASQARAIALRAYGELFDAFCQG